MAAKAGKIFSGEDSESEEEEEDEPMWVPTIAPKAPVLEKAPVPPASPATVVAPTLAADENVPTEPSSTLTQPAPSPIDIPASAQATPLASPLQPVPDENDVWRQALSSPFTEVDGMDKMSLAAASKLQSVLDGTLEQIRELVESQEHLLNVVSERNAKITRNAKIAGVEQTMSQVPIYFQKVVAMKSRMADMTASIERMKKQAEYFQVEAQSRAIAKEDRRDKMSQWNILLSAKPSNDLQRKLDEGAPSTLGRSTT
ncbi:hypothetical protein SDRG_14757 [Saprolegnia diclina VS20]|uniref:Uncharacterized protein n=1 Tax=Saprolegnia diclina (strain VS20) TaxID=1156394 RepID=T0R5V5_SAPDV|nr:hypothetical protein SDRG_14757 [Saprolegnia diclina VS20]EQC27433.1 hypothetical protein SDRG_14757 [Saprolegnia diclina VS20]|eukprot:XP_008619133.1 hypothetical protein SDRG_14757 [Saprolegnia diclina VS20]